MDNVIVDALVGIGELTLIMLFSAFVLGFGYLVKQALLGKSCDKK